MKTLQILLLLLTFKTYLCSDINKLFEKINKEYEKFNSVAAKISWDSSIEPDNPDLKIRSAKYQKNLLIWQQKTCDRLATLDKSQLLNTSQRRQTFLLCNGPIFTFKEARLLSNLYLELQSIYSNAEICIPIEKHISEMNLTTVEEAILNYLMYIKDKSKMTDKDYVPLAAEIATKQKWKEKSVVCLKGEDDFQNMMAFSRHEEVLRWLWLAWRDKIGPPMRQPYQSLVEIENRAARRNGYPNIGVSWREDLEIPHLKQLCRKLYNDILPLYKTLHGVVRYFLRKYYGYIVPEKGPIPAHLLGNMWGENWDSILDLILKDKINFDDKMKENNWTVLHMVKRAEDFYQSLGLPAMSDTFWRESLFNRENHTNPRCHGAAADMFQNGDFRLLFCGDVSIENFYVLHHELGHIQYYMAYEQQPSIFREAHKALHEAIGDTIMYGVMTPQHLHRLGLINDTVLYATNHNNDLIKLEQDGTYDKELPEENFGARKHMIGKRNSYINNETHPNNDLEVKIDKDSVQIKTNNRKMIIYHPKQLLSNNDNVNVDYEAAGPFDNKIITIENSQHTNTNNKDRSYLEPIPKTHNIKAKLDKRSINCDERAEENTEDLKLSKISFEDVLLLKQALNKIPQITFSLLIDEYRWKYFEGKLDSVNKNFWDLALEMQGIVPPGRRGEEYFDAGAKFHVPDNTPFIRYFLSSFLQHQLFETLCKAAVFGRRNVDEPLPPTIAMNKCDIYGSKTVGKILKDLMSRGHSQRWSDILEAITGERVISSAPLERYYRPLYKWLRRFVRAHRIPIGW